MKRASEVLLTVATIVSTVVAALLFALVPLFIVLGVSPVIHDMVLQGIKDGELTIHGVTPEQAVAIFQGVFIGTGILLCFIAGVCLANAIVSSKARRNPTHNLLVASIVLGALSTDFSLVGGIFGLISLSRAERQKTLIE